MTTDQFMLLFCNTRRIYPSLNLKVHTVQYQRDIAYVPNVLYILTKLDICSWYKFRCL